MPWIPVRPDGRRPAKPAEKEKKSGWDKLSAIGSFASGLAVLAAFGALAVGIWEFKDQQATTAMQTFNQERQDAINQYFDDMSALVLQDKLATANPSQAVRAIAEARTYTTVRYLDGQRKGTLIRFLREAALITVPNPVVSLKNSDLRDISVPRTTILGDVNLSSLNLRGAVLEDVQLLGVDFSGSDLTDINLSYSQLTCSPPAKGNPRICVDLSGATLSNAWLVAANLTAADLTAADLAQADLAGADMNNARLIGAQLGTADLRGASLRGATYNARPIAVPESGETVTEPPTQWPPGFDPRAAGAVCVDC